MLEYTKCNDDNWTQGLDGTKAIVCIYTHSVDAGELLRQLHDHADDEGRPQCRAADELGHGDGGLCLLGMFLGLHLLYVLVHLITRS